MCLMCVTLLVCLLLINIPSVHDTVNFSSVPPSKSYIYQFLLHSKVVSTDMFHACDVRSLFVMCVTFISMWTVFVKCLTTLYNYCGGSL